jgi:hypothetical protein
MLGVLGAATILLSACGGAETVSGSAAPASDAPKPLETSAPASPSTSSAPSGNAEVRHTARAAPSAARPLTRATPTGTPPSCGKTDLVAWNGMG